MDHDDNPERVEGPQPPEPESEESYWQWVALVVLLACWLAESML